MNAKIRKFTALAIMLVMVMGSMSVLVAQGAEQDSNGKTGEIASAYEHEDAKDVDYGNYTQLLKGKGDDGSEFNPPDLKDSGADAGTGAHIRTTDSVGPVMPHDVKKAHVADSFDGSDESSSSGKAVPFITDSTSGPSGWKVNPESERTGYDRPVPAVNSTNSSVVVYNVNSNLTYSSIQAAIDNATGGDSLIIRGSSVENMTITGKDINIVDSFFNLTGNIVVNPGANLSIDPSYVNLTGNLSVSGSVEIYNDTVIQFNSSYDGEYGITVYPDGTLILLNNSMVKSYGAYGYRFHVLSGAGLDIINSTVRDAGWNETDTGLMIMTDNIWIYNSTFTNCSAGIVMVGASYGKIENSTFYGNEMGGIGVIDGSNGNYIANNSFEGAEGVHIENSSGDRVIGNRIYYASYGIYLYNSTSGVIEGNRIDGVTGIYMANSSSNFISGGYITTKNGMEIFNSSDNNISSNDIRAYHGIDVLYSENTTFYNNSITYRMPRIYSDGLVAYWRMDEDQWNGTAGEVRDSSGNGNDGTAYGADISVNGGVSGNAGYFDGNRDYIKDINSDAFNTGNELTLEAWVYLPNAGNDQKIIGKASTATGSVLGGYILGVTNSKIYPEVWDTSNTRYSFEAGSIDSSTWTQLVVTYTAGGELKAYINGVEVGNTTAGSAIRSLPSSVVIGAAPWDQRYYGTRGKIDEVKVYNRALNATEIENEYLAAYGSFGIHMKNDTNSRIYANGQGIDSFRVGTAIYLDNSSPYINGMHTTNSDFGVVCVNASSPYIENSNIDWTTDDEVYASNNSHPVLLDSGVYRYKLNVADELSNITVRWHMNIHTTDSSGDPVSAHIHLISNLNDYMDAGYTDPTTGNLSLVETQYVANYTGTTVYSPYNVYADDGTSYGSQSVNLNTVQYVDIKLVLPYVHDIEQDAYYPGISVAVMNADPGDHIEVYNSTYMYNESVLVNKPVHIAGASGSMPAVNGGGGTASFRIVSEGVEISHFRLGYDSMGILATAGGFDIHDNSFQGYDEALYVEIYYEGGGPTRIGDMSFHNNVLNDTMGVLFGDVGFSSPVPGANISAGNISIKDNRMYVEYSDAISTYCYVEDTNGGHVNWGSVDITGNNITAPDGYGINIYSYVYNINDTRMSLGGYNIFDNNITSERGILVDYWDIGHLSGDTNIVAENTYVENNTFEVDDGDALDIYVDAMYEFYDTAYVRTGSTYVRNNIMMADSTSAGVYINMEDVGADMHGKSSLYVGNVYVNENDMERSGVGIVMYLANSGVYMYDESSVRLGNFSITDNYMEFEGYGEYILISNSLQDMYNSSSYIIGDFSVSNNTMISDGTETGMYWYMRDSMVTVYDQSYWNMGRISMENNSVTTNGTGIHVQIDNCINDLETRRSLIWNDISIRNNSISAEQGLIVEITRSAYEIYLSEISLPSIIVMDNHINASGGGIEVTLSAGSDTYDSTVHVGKVGIYDNTVFIHGGNNPALTLQYSEIGEDMMSESRVDMKMTEVTGNELHAWNGTGLLTTIDTIGSDMSGNSAVSVADISVHSNNISSENGEGVSMNMDDIAYENIGNSEVRFGNVSVYDNAVSTNMSSDKDGITSSIGGTAYKIKEFSSASFGDMRFENNNISSGGAGLRIISENLGKEISYDWDADFPLAGACHVTIGNMQVDGNTINSNNSAGIYMEANGYGVTVYGSSSVSMGNFEFMNNHIDTESDGIYAEINYIGVDIHDSTSISAGSILFRENVINSGGMGMNINGLGYMGFFMDGYSNFHMKNIEIADNLVNSTDDGISADNFENIMAGLDGYSSASVDGIVVCNNTVRAGNETNAARGIYFDDLRDAASHMDGYSTASLGDIKLNNNTVNSTGYGIAFSPYMVASHLSYASSAYIGNMEVTGNVVNASSGGGLGVSMGFSSAEYLYESSTARIGNTTITNNRIAAYGANSIGLVTGVANSAFYLHDAANVSIGNLLVENNSVLSNESSGIYITHNNEIRYMNAGDYSTSSGKAVIGDTVVDHNDVYAKNGTGIINSIDDTLYSIEDTSEGHIGSTSIEDNSIHAMNGIYFLEENSGAELETNCSMASNIIRNNEIWANESEGTGIKVMLTRLGEAEGAGDVYLGDLYLVFNTIYSSNHGMDITYSDAGYTDDISSLKLPGIYSANNTVKASDLGLSISTSDNHEEDYISTQDWGKIEVRDSEFDAPNGTSIESDGTDRPLIWLHNLTFTGDGSPHSSGIHFDGPGDGILLIERCDFSGYEDGVLGEGGYGTVGSSSFTGIGGYDVNLTGSSHLFMVDDGFNKANVLFQDNESTLDIGWYITVNVVTQTGGAVPYANVRSVSNTSAPGIFYNNFTVDENGQKTIMLREYRQNITGIIEQYNPYNMTGSKGGLTGWMVPDPTPIDASKNVYIVLNDHNPPVLGEDRSDRSGTTGDPFTFRVNATDNICVDHVTVYYRYGDSGSFSSALMDSVGPVEWTYTMNLRSDFVGDMEYYFVVTDRADNTYTGTSRSVPVTDNDAPSGLVDNSPPVLSAPTYTFNMSISDNIGVAAVYVVYMQDTDSPTNISMSGTGPYTAEINTQYRSNSTMSYYFTAVDAAGNWFVGPVKTISVNDTNPPTIGNDTSDTAGTTGDPFTFRVYVSDDFSGVASVVATYWFAGEQGVEVTLNGSGNGIYSASVNLPEDRVGKMYYVFNATDNAGNSAMSDTMEVNVTDNDPPSVLDASIGNVSKGTSYVLIAEAHDNIGVASVSVEYWFDNGSHRVARMNQAGDLWLLAIDVPQSASELHYIFNASDGNLSSESPQYDREVVKAVDSEPPQVSDSTNSFAVAGRPFSFSAVAIDNVEVSAVYVEYWFDNGTHENVSMTNMGSSWEYDIDIPQDAGVLHYFFTAIDSSGNTAHTGEISKNVEQTPEDDEPPVITDMTSGTPQQGSVFTISASVTDNGEVAGVYVEYWFDDGTHENMSMSLNSGVWKYEISVPSGVSVLHYIISARDAYYNWNSLNEASLEVSTAPGEDTTPPTMGSLNISGTIAEGSEITFTISASDESGVSMVYVVYWTDKVGEQRALLTGDNGVYSGNITVPKGSKLHYYAVAEDMNGNTGKTEEMSKEIGESGTSLPGGSLTAESALPYILIIIVLLAIIGYLAYTRNKNEPVAMTPVEPESEDVPPGEEEQGADEAGESYGEEAESGEELAQEETGETDEAGEELEIDDMMEDL